MCDPTTHQLDFIGYVFIINAPFVTIPPEWDFLVLETLLYTMDCAGACAQVLFQERHDERAVRGNVDVTFRC